jgi:hypothetical protein
MASARGIVCAFVGVALGLLPAGQRAFAGGNGLERDVEKADIDALQAQVDAMQVTIDELRANQEQQGKSAVPAYVAPPVLPPLEDNADDAPPPTPVLPALGPGCAVFDPDFDCERTRTSTTDLLLDFEIEQLNGLGFSCHDCTQPSSSGAAVPYPSGTQPGPAKLREPLYAMPLPAMEVDGDTFGLRGSIGLADIVVGRDAIGVTFPVEAEIHHRFGLIEPYAGLDGMVLQVADMSTAHVTSDLTGVELSGRLGGRVWLTPSMTVAGWYEKSIVGTFPMSAVGLSIGGAFLDYSDASAS